VTKILDRCGDFELHMSLAEVTISLFHMRDMNSKQHEAGDLSLITASYRDCDGDSYGFYIWGKSRNMTLN
jgi:hypothetical protein